MEIIKLYWKLVCYHIPTLATRRTYFVTCLFGMVISYALLGIDFTIAYCFPVLYPDFGIAVLQTAFAGWMLIPGWRFASSRLRDTGKYSWKTLLWVLVPIIGFFVILWALTRPTEHQSFSNGPKGPKKEDWNKFHSGIEISPEWRNLNHSLVVK